MIREGDPASVERALETVVTLSTAIENGDLRAAASAAEDLEGIRIPVTALAEATVSAIENDEGRRGRLLLGELLRQYGRLRRERGAAVARAIHLRDTADLPYSRRVAMNDFVADERRAAAARAQFLAAAGTALAGEDAPPEGSDELAGDLLAELVDRERDTGEAARDVAAVSAADPMPAVSVLPLSADPRVVAGNATTIAPTVANVGGQPVSVSLSVNTVGDDTLVTVDGTTGEIGDIGPGNTGETTVTLSGTEPGTARLTVAANVDDRVGDTRTIEVDVTETLPLALAVDRDGNGRIDTAEMQRAIERWDASEAVPDTDGIVPDADGLRELLVLWSEQLPVR